MRFSFTIDFFCRLIGMNTMKEGRVREKLRENTGLNKLASLEAALVPNSAD